MKEELRKKKNPRGQGSIRVNKYGNYEYRFQYVDELDRARSKSITCKTIDECVEKAEAFKKKMEIKRKTTLADSTVSEIIRKRIEMDYKKNYTGEQGYGRNLDTLKVIERHAIGSIKIDQVKPVHIDEFLAHITCYSDKTISKIYSMLRSAFDMAYEEHAIEINYMRRHDAKRPRSSKPAKKVRGFTEEEQLAFLKTLEEYKTPYGSNSYRLQLLIELYSGMRMGEINALRPEDIDFSKKKINVRSTVARGVGNHNFIKEGTKTDAGMRYVPISSVLEPILYQAIKEMKPNPLGLIFFDFGRRKKKSEFKEGGIVETTQVNSYFKRVCKKAGLPEEFGQHSLRHTFATRCIEAGVQPVVLQRWLGHTDIHMTLDTYTDVFAKMHEESTEKFDQRISEIYSRGEE